MRFCGVALDDRGHSGAQGCVDGVERPEIISLAKAEKPVIDLVFDLIARLVAEVSSVWNLIRAFELVANHISPFRREICSIPDEIDSRPPLASSLLEPS